MNQTLSLNDGEIREIIRAYFEVLEGGGAESCFGQERGLPYPKELISRALVAALRRWPDGSDWERWRAGFIEMERFLGEVDWDLVEEFSARANEGPEAILAMDMARMQAANSITRAVSLRKLRRMEEINDLSLPGMNTGSVKRDGED
ncbi:MAG: hypothetical protein QF787_12050 [Nitrospinota bacterium]|jgi:hypothetical protein|nr:hypothetical protein [Nitrospinota bacterium]|tara:strand:+ start:139 stop:579 length:441 start_codon:yes stop_codon:yes gene_type:complete